MKKIIAIFCCAFVFAFFLSACFGSKVYPDMVEYDEAEVLEVAKEKYGIQSFEFTGSVIRGSKCYDENGEFYFSEFSERFSTDFINGDNIEAAFSSFAGKNGNHDIQGKFRNFLCYVALGVGADGQAKFIYYNLNLNKYAEIADTIGCSDYPYDILPSEITDELLTVPQDWGAMNVYMNRHFKNIGNALSFSGNRLSCGYSERVNQYVTIEFYRENGQIVYDLIYINDSEPHIVYSTSDRYGVLYNYYGIDKSAYVDVEYTVTQSEEDPAYDLLAGTVKIKPLDGTIIYSQLNVREWYQVLNRQGAVTTYENTSAHMFMTEVEKSVLINRIDGVDHIESAKIECTNFYILYEKTV